MLSECCCLHFFVNFFSFSFFQFFFIGSAQRVCHIKRGYSVTVGLSVAVCVYV